MTRYKAEINMTRVAALIAGLTSLGVITASTPVMAQDINKSDDDLRWESIEQVNQLLEPEVPSTINNRINRLMQRQYPESEFNIKDIEMEYRKWRNDCLGLAKPRDLHNEICDSEGLVPGYKVTIIGEFQGNINMEAAWVFHIDQDLLNTRFNEEASRLPIPEDQFNLN